MIVEFRKIYSIQLGANAEGSTLNITRISRKHMGKYRCDANNGIPPAASQIFKIEVHCKISNVSHMSHFLFIRSSVLG